MGNFEVTILCSGRGALDVALGLAKEHLGREVGWSLETKRYSDSQGPDIPQRFSLCFSRPYTEQHEQAPRQLPFEMPLDAVGEMLLGWLAKQRLDASGVDFDVDVEPGWRFHADSKGVWVEPAWYLYGK